jgi:hypothetical protein
LSFRDPIRSVADRPVVETGIPQINFLTALLVETIRASTLNEPHRFLKAVCRRWGDHDVEMVGHQNVFMKQVFADRRDSAAQSESHFPRFLPRGRERGSGMPSL